eukprot:scaffold72311_cov39-Cyclotella_meneghiniana.AAC.1
MILCKCARGPRAVSPEKLESSYPWCSRAVSNDLKLNKVENELKVMTNSDTASTNLQPPLMPMKTKKQRARSARINNSRLEVHQILYVRVGCQPGYPSGLTAREGC